MAQLLRIRIGRKNQEEPNFDLSDYDFIGESSILGVSILEGGMASGKAAVGIIIELPKETGKVSTLIQITEDNFEGLYAAFKGAKQHWVENPLP